MAKVSKVPVIEKYTQDKPDHKPLNPDQRAVLIIRHAPTGWVIRSWGWTLKEVLAHLGWDEKDVMAAFVRAYSRNRGAVLLSKSSELDQAIASLNDQ